MLDLILATFVAAVFSGGFWCGQKFRTVAAMKAALLNLFK
jgi:hypothetical protein